MTTEIETETTIHNAPVEPEFEARVTCMRERSLKDQDDTIAELHEVQELRTRVEILNGSNVVINWDGPSIAIGRFGEGLGRLGRSRGEGFRRGCGRNLYREFWIKGWS